MAHAISNGRDRYDIEKVYNWNQEFTTLFTPSPSSGKAQGKKYPEDYSVDGGTYALDLHSLLHIRNFWHRHLLGDCHVLLETAGFGENTYSTMTNGLAELGHSPKPWNLSLRDWSTDLDEATTGKWYGHYSCIHRPWPRTRKDLNDRQSCAEDWDKVEPLVK